MWHEELQLWQSTRETRPDLGMGNPAGPLLLAPRDPSRVVLVISRPDMDSGWISTTRPSAAEQGIPFGRDPADTIKSNANIDVTGNIDPVTGDVVVVIKPFTLDATNKPLGATSITWTVREHGILAQSEWWAWDPFPGCPWHVIEVIMPRNPANPDPGNPYARSLQRGTWQPNRRPAVGRGSDNLDQVVRPQPTPCRTATSTVLPESLLALIRPSCRSRRRVHCVSRRSSSADDS